MIAHTGFGVSDFTAAKRFYERALAPLGYTAKMQSSEAAGFNDGKNTDFWIGRSDTVEPMHVAFEAKSREQVEQFYRAALAAGGRDNGEPGYRPQYWPGYYAAFVHDLDGHNIEAVWYDYGAEKTTGGNEESGHG
jgi:catechol 2,3-dioxygenase-like lactoylglutathione lyase family enzyme